MVDPNLVPGAEYALTDDEIRDFFRVAAAVDWTRPVTETRALLQERFGWRPLGRRGTILETPTGASGSAGGTPEETDRLQLEHTCWDPEAPAESVDTAARMAAVSAVITALIGGTPATGRSLDGEDGTYWNFADGSRCWVDGTDLLLLSPTLAAAETWAVNNPAAYASYGED
ncbi:hypothetical protein [Granulicoccus phenolivorans]|uniref:hypothetical protein n=1 Tax=Granulicoccus phenolivorans TaxID=266854 RepID=UPI00040184BB|nr:hypothetical protein [Granulicoccus phenolivorans]